MTFHVHSRGLCAKTDTTEATLKLTPNKKNTITMLLRQLGARQGELSRKSSYASGNLSEFLNPAKAKGCTPETWTRLVGALEDMVADPCRAELRSANPEIDKALAQIRSWREGEEEQDAGDPSPRASGPVYPPGGPLPLDAANYLQRLADRAIDDVIRLPGPRTVLVKGGIGTGRTSLLCRLRKAAEDVDALVVMLDEHFLANVAFALAQERQPDDNNPEERSTGRKPAGEDLKAKVTQRIVQHIGYELKLRKLQEIPIEKTDARAIAAVVLESLESAGIDREVYLIFDDASAWPETLGVLDHVADLVMQLQLQLLGRWQFPFKLVVTSAFTSTEETAAFGSRLETQSIVGPLSFFSADETIELAKIFNVSSQDALTIHAETLGHPRFTEMLLYVCGTGVSVLSAVEAARGMDAEGGWDSSASRILLVLRHLIQANGIAVDECLKKIVVCLGDPVSSLPKISKEDEDILRTIGALTGRRPKPTVVPLFCHWAALWLESESL